MTTAPLTACIGKLVELRFEDGEVVHGTLLAVDPDDHEDLTYEVVRVLRPGIPPSLGTAVGATVVAPLHALEGFHVL